MDESIQNQQELMALVVMLANRYTHLESTSIPYEKAESLMKAVVYTIAHGTIAEENKESFMQVPVACGEKITLEKRYYRGKQKIYDMCQQLHEKYNEIAKNFEDYGCIALRETFINAFPGFFQYYSIDFEPFNTIITMDYNLLTKRYLEQEGIDAITEYLKEIELEQKFLSRMKKSYIEKTLDTISPGYENLFDNMTEPMLLNLILRSMLRNGEIDPSNMKLNVCNERALMQVLHRETISLTQNHFDNDVEINSYLSGYITALFVRIRTANENNCIKKFLMI